MMSNEDMKGYKGLDEAQEVTLDDVINEGTEGVDKDFVSIDDEYSGSELLDGGSLDDAYIDGDSLDDDIDFGVHVEDSELDFGEPVGGESLDDLYPSDEGGEILDSQLMDSTELVVQSPEDLVAHAKQVKEEIQAAANPVTLDYMFEDKDGNMISPRNYEGGYLIDMVPIERIKGVGSMESQMRKGDLELAELQEDIHRYGVLVPLHVVPTKWVGEKDGRPVYSRYLLMNGRRRLEVCINLGYTEVPVLVDSTIPTSLIKVYEAVVNNQKEYEFQEKLKHARFLIDTHKNITNEMIESVLGWRSGEYLKAQYIDQMKNEFPDIYRAVEIKKMTIEQGFKKIEKEIEKAEKEAQGLSQQEIEDDLREKGRDELAELQIEKQQQTVGDRKPLDPMIRKAVEVRDRHCQCCGYGKDEEDFMGIFKVHHIIAVQYGGSDSKYNLILLCNNCHELVHNYESARFLPSRDTYDRRNDVKRIVVLGNMLKHMRKLGIAELKAKHGDVWRQVDKGVLSVGKGILKAGLNLKGEEIFAPSPYERFIEVTADLDLGVGVQGDLGDIYWDDEEEEAGEGKPVVIEAEAVEVE